MAWLALPAAGQEPAKKAADPVESLLQQYSYERVKEEPDPAAPAPARPATEDGRYHEYKMAQEQNKILVAVLLVVTALAAQFFLLRCLRNCANPSPIVSGTALIYIVFGVIVLVVVSDTKDQLTASTGILGAIAGYLFGTMRRGDEGASQPTSERQPN